MPRRTSLVGGSPGTFSAGSRRTSGGGSIDRRFSTIQGGAAPEEQEKLNVWIALLNLENTFGTEESLEKAFKEASRMCDSKTVHLRLASILDESQKTEV